MSDKFIEDLIKSAKESIVTVYVNEFTEESAKEFRDEFLSAERSGQTIIPIVIDSYGGSVHALFHMIDLIKSATLPVATIATGKAMSCGIVLLSSGTKGYRFASENCSIMIHEVSSVNWGKNVELQNEAKETERLNNLLLKTLDENCDEDVGYWKKYLKEIGMVDLFLTGKQAKKHGLIDVVKVPRIEAELTVTTKLV